MQCKVCASLNRAAVDAALAAGESARSLAIAFGLSPESMKRHARSHARSVAPAQPAAAADEIDPLVELAAALKARALGGDPNSAREYRLILSALAARGQAPAPPDVLHDPEYVRARTIILEALRPFPAARLAVADALRADLAANP
jgi:hypothetical protein